MDVGFWRRWHRWISFPATLFLCWAAVTGVILAFTEFFGADEALREATRKLVSPVTVSSPDTQWSNSVVRALRTIAANNAGAPPPIDKIELQFKGPQPTVTVFTGKPAGGEDRKFTVDAKTGALLKNEDYADKPFLNRLHSGEAFGDGGLVAAMAWGVVLAFLSFSGLIIYLLMRGNRKLTGWQRVFW